MQQFLMKICYEMLYNLERVLFYSKSTLYSIEIKFRYIISFERYGIWT